MGEYGTARYHIWKSKFDFIFLYDIDIFIDMGKLNKKIVIRVTRRQLEHIVLETIKQKKNISQVVRKALNEQITSRVWTRI